jgi:hypothetical protein
MATIPGDVDADRGPPLSIPLRQFVAALGFLLAGSALGVADAFGVAPGLAVFAANLALVVWRHAPDALRHESAPAARAD